MRKSVKNATIAASLLTSIGIFVFFAASVLSQIIFGANYAHMEALLLSALDTIKDSFGIFTGFALYPFLTLLLGVMFVLFSISWIIVSIVRKTKGAIAIIFDSIVFGVFYFALIVMVLDTSDIFYKSQLEIEKGGKSLLVLFVSYIIGGSNANPIYTFGMLAAFAFFLLAIFFALCAFIFDAFIKNKKLIADPLDEYAEKHAKKEEPKVEKEILPQVKEVKPIQEDGYNKDDPIEKLFADIESNREELKEPLEKKNEESEIEELPDEVIDN